MSSAVTRQLLVVVASLALLVMLVLAGRVVGAEWYFRAAEREAGFWGHPDYTPDAELVSATVARLDRAVELWPANPDYKMVAARALMWQAYWDTEPSRAAQLEERALVLMLQAAELRPAQRSGWEAARLEFQRLGLLNENSARVVQQLRRLGVDAGAGR